MIITVDFTRTGELNPWNQDLVINAAATRMIADDVLEQVSLQAAQAGVFIDVPGLKRIMGIERRQEKFILRTLYPDPQTAELLTDLWAQQADRALRETLLHAQRAELLQRYLFVLQNCPSPALFASGQAELDMQLPPLCDSESNLLPANLQSVQADLERELQLGRGLSSAVLFDFSQQAEVSNQPLIFNANWQALAGALIALFLGSLVVGAGWLERFLPARDGA